MMLSICQNAHKFHIPHLLNVSNFFWGGGGDCMAFFCHVHRDARLGASVVAPILLDFTHRELGIGWAAETCDSQGASPASVIPTERRKFTSEGVQPNRWENARNIGNAAGKLRYHLLLSCKCGNRCWEFSKFCQLTGTVIFWQSWIRAVREQWSDPVALL